MPLLSAIASYLICFFGRYIAIFTRFEDYCLLLVIVEYMRLIIFDGMDWHYFKRTIANRSVRHSVPDYLIRAAWIDIANIIR